MKRRRRSCSAALASGGVEGGAGGGLAMRSPLELEGEGERRGIEREMAPGGGVWTRGRDGDRAGLARVRRDWWGRLGLDGPAREDARPRLLGSFSLSL